MTPTTFRIALYASLAVCALGLLWRVATWFSRRIGPEARTVSIGQRLAAAIVGSLKALSPRNVPHFLKAILVDTMLQGRLFAADKLRWLGHLLILWGFTFLLGMHALAAIVTAKLFAGYQPTLDPYQALRNLFGAMVIVGVALLVAGRLRTPRVARRPRRLGDSVFMGLLGLVMATGFLLEGAKIASPRAFYRMADSYIGTTDPAELLPLRTVWAADFGVAFDDLPDSADPKVLEEGRELHRDACASCHTPTTSAFVSYPVSRAMAPVIGPLDAGQADAWLLYVHLVACFLGIATLPFTRLFHAVSDPVALMVNGAAPNAAFTAAGRASRRALALDACTSCGICDDHCSVAPVARSLRNPELLPSHKLLATGAVAGGSLRQPGSAPQAAEVSEGAFLCTDCGRCTARCPVGLDLADMWTAQRADLAAAGLPSLASWIQARPAVEWADTLASRPGREDVAGPLSGDRGTFVKCVQCQTCTNVCPVVAHSIDPESGADLTPQKVMNLLRLGLADLAIGSRMVWDCATCYQCQEHCPEGVRVTDVMCELRSLAHRRLGAVRDGRQPA